MIDLYTAATPNGWKASICLEELELQYAVRPMRLERLEQKQDWYFSINPNGRIPAIVDRGDGDFAVFESGAILMYLAEKTGRLMPTDRKGRSTVVQWLMFQMGGLGPMMGQAAVFNRYAPERIEWAIGRYERESRRLLEVLDRRLGEAEYLAGDFSIADIAHWAWAQSHEYAGVDIEGLENLDRWLQAVGKRPGVQRGRKVPQSFAPEKSEERLVDGVRKMLA